MSVRLRPEAAAAAAEFPALYATARKRVLNPHEFARLTTSRAYCKAAIEPPRTCRYSIIDIWEPDAARQCRSAARLRRYEAEPASRPPRPAVRYSATAQITTLGGCLVHPIIELDFVGGGGAAGADIHRYPHLRKFCSMVDFDLLSPQRVVAFYTTVRLFPDRWRQMFRFRMTERALLGAARYNDVFAFPAPAELLEIAEAYREYFLPTAQIASLLVERHKALLESAQKLVGHVFAAETRNDSFRLTIFLVAVLRPCVGDNFALIERLFALIGETRVSLSRPRDALLKILKNAPTRAENDDIAALLAEFRLPKRKYWLLTPKRTNSE